MIIWCFEVISLYQESFFIRGNRNVFRGLGEAAILKIEKCNDGNCGTVTDPHTYFWWLKGTESDFEFYINQSLQFGASYRLTFDFYSKKENTSIKEQIRQRALPQLQGLYNRQDAITRTQIRETLQQVVTDVISDRCVEIKFTLMLHNGWIGKIARDERVGNKILRL